MNEKEIKRLIDHTVGITNAIIVPEITPKGCVIVRSPDGGVYEDDVSTHHLAELLMQLDKERFSPIINSIVKWFIDERKDLHNPFFVTTLAHAGIITNENIKETVEKSIMSQKRKSGLIDMYAAFLDGGSIFSTLWATEILLSIQVSDEYNDIIRNALKAVWRNWGDVHRTSFKGFFLELLLKFGDFNDLPEPRDIVDEIIQNQDDTGIWDDSYLYTFYILSNLIFASKWDPDIIPIIEESFIKIFELGSDIDGPPSFVKKSATKYAESLFLQACIRSVITADKYLKLKELANTVSEGLTSNFIGTWPTLYYHARRLEVRIKEMENQYGNIEKEFRHIRKKAKALLERSPHHKNVFIMMPLQPYIEGKDPYVNLVKEIKSILKKEGFTGWVATDIQLDSMLWNNVAAYLEGCKYGIAIFTRRKKGEGNKIYEEEYFNPNVSLEIGFMLARGKKVLILKEKTLQKMTADLVGHLYKEFDLEKSIEVRSIVRKWIREIKRKEDDK